MSLVMGTVAVTHQVVGAAMVEIGQLGRMIALGVVVQATGPGIAHQQLVDEVLGQYHPHVLGLVGLVAVEIDMEGTVIDTWMTDMIGDATVTGTDLTVGMIVMAVGIVMLVTGKNRQPLCLNFR